MHGIPVFITTETPKLTDDALRAIRADIVTGIRELGWRHSVSLKLMGIRIPVSDNIQ